LKIVVCPFHLFLLAIVLSVLLRFTDFDYPFDIFKLLLKSVRFWSFEEEKIQNRRPSWLEVEYSFGRS